MTMMSGGGKAYKIITILEEAVDGPESTTWRSQDHVRNIKMYLFTFYIFMTSGG